MTVGIYHATGKRKTAVARVWMRPGKGEITINKRPLEQYMVVKSDKVMIMEPFEVTDTAGKFDVYVNVRGGGISGQAGAIRHGISRALIIMDPELRDTLKKQRLLTRDPRMKERKKYGQPGARARFQYSKR